VVRPFGVDARGARSAANEVFGEWVHTRRSARIPDALQAGGPRGQERIMETKLAVRIDRCNPDHHLWNNHGTWWCHYTVHPTEHTVRRVRRSLSTPDLLRARELRDELFSRLGGADAGEVRS